jgi:hypothetical protein
MNDEELLQHLTTESRTPPPHPTMVIEDVNADTVLALLLLYFEYQPAVAEVRIKKGRRTLGFLHRDVLYEISPTVTRAIGDLDLDLDLLRVGEDLQLGEQFDEEPSINWEMAVNAAGMSVLGAAASAYLVGSGQHRHHLLRRRRARPPAGHRRTRTDHEERRLQAQVSDRATGTRHKFAFAAGREHDVAVHIGPKDRYSVAAGTPFPESEVDYSQGDAVLDIGFVTAGPDGRTKHQSRRLLLPPTGPTAQAMFSLEVPANAKTVLATILVFQGARMLQTAQLRGPVTRDDRAVDGRRIELVSTAEIVSTPTPVASGPAMEASLSFQVGRSDEVLLKIPSGPGHLVTLPPDMAEFNDDIIYLLRQAVADDAEDGAEPGSDQQVELLRGLARRGSFFYQQLRPSLRGLALKDSLQITTKTDDVVPLEFVYDLGYPSEEAKLCRGWQAALQTGRCTCRRRDQTVGTICPLGFWGLRLIIERLAASDGDADVRGQFGPHRTVLPDLTRVLFAASAKVDNHSPGERERTTQLLQEHLGGGVATADSWSGWEKAIKAHHPGLLLTLPHNDEAADSLPVLEIGDRSRLEVGGLRPRHVLAHNAPVGPVVMLLGCTTAHDEIAWQSAAAAFRRRGASVVVGTLAETLGRQSAPMARMLADSLWGPDAVQGATMGEVMRQVRRRLVADGATLGMSLVAFGHTGWLVQQASGDGG